MYYMTKTTYHYDTYDEFINHSNEMKLKGFEYTTVTRSNKGITVNYKKVGK